MNTYDVLIPPPIHINGTTIPLPLRFHHAVVIHGFCKLRSHTEISKILGIGKGRSANILNEVRNTFQCKDKAAPKALYEQNNIGDELKEYLIKKNIDLRKYWF